MSAPTITAVSPIEGDPDGGNSVTLTGTNFVSGMTVEFGGKPASNVVIVNSTTATCDAPSELWITGISPATGTDAGGDTITITGRGFEAGATVTIGGAAATSVVIDSATQITCDTPSGTAGDVDVVVTVGADSATLTDGFEFTGAAWTPADITTLAWLDADDPATLTLSGSNVTDWDDKSGNGYDAGIQGTCAQIATGIGGLNAVEIGASNGDFLRFTPNIPITAGSYFAFYVFRWKSDPGNNLGLFRDGSDFQLVRTPSNRPWIRRAGADFQASTNRQFVIDEDVTSGWGFDSESEFFIYMDGEKEHSQATAVIGGAFDIGDFGYQSSTGERFHAYFSQIIFFDEVPSQSDREKLEGWAAHKYGLQGSLPAAHQYKSAPP